MKLLRFDVKKRKIIVLIALIFFVITTLISAPHPREMFLQHSATLLAVFFLLWDIKNSRISFYAFCMICCFFVFHAIGARWIYSFVPYDMFFEKLIGVNVSSFFEWERNHYDRFVHFLFGVLLFPAVYDLMKNKLLSNKLIKIIFVFLIIQFFSMFYELFEWCLTFVLSPEAVEDYNGQQGDMWDAQKDMALAMLGSFIYALFFYLFGLRESTK